jgi:hypothetical protein
MPTEYYVESFGPRRREQASAPVKPRRRKHGYCP